MSSWNVGLVLQCVHFDAVPFMIFFVMIVLCQLAVLSWPYTGNHNGINTMVNVIYPLFLGVDILNSPNLTEIRCSQSFYNKYPIEERLQIQSAVL